jgi:hypothetical protein
VATPIITKAAATHSSRTSSNSSSTSGQLAGELGNNATSTGGTPAATPLYDLPPEETTDLEELEQFAKTFKQRRIKLGNIISLSSGC